MIRQLSSQMTAAAVGIALLVPAGMGIATADPDLNWAVSTKCDYSQVVAAMKVQSPAAAAQLDATPAEQSFLQTFLTAPPAQRQQMLEQAESSPEGAQLISAFQPIANTCTNY